MVIENFSEICGDDQLEFINSFDKVLTDMDGVIWVTFVAIPGAPECIDNFKRLGKSVNFVTNFAMSTREVTHQTMLKYKFTANPQDIINPCVAVVEYLKRHNFQKKIYALSTTIYKEELRKEGFNVADDPPQQIEESVKSVLQNIQDDEEIGAVVFDYDLNLTTIKLQKALTYLKRQDCLFITGGGDKVLPIGPMGPMLGNYYFYQCLTEISGRQPIQLAKPSKEYNELITRKLNIENPERVLFIGDMINEDMRFAANAGYKKLLVLSGNSKIDDVQDWKYPEAYKPDYYIQSLSELNAIIKTIENV